MRLGGYFSTLTAVGHLGFDRKWIFKIPSSEGSHSAQVCQMYGWVIDD